MSSKHSTPLHSSRTTSSTTSMSGSSTAPLPSSNVYSFPTKNGSSSSNTAQSLTSYLSSLPSTEIEPVFLTVASQKLFGVTSTASPPDIQPFRTIPKDEILGDIEGKGVLSDFYGIKDRIEAYTGIEVLVIYDDEDKSKKRFFACLSEDRAAEIMNRLHQTTEHSDSENPVNFKKRNDAFELVRLARSTVDTEEAIKEESVILNRDLIRVSISRKRREFGGGYRFTDSDAHDGLVECRQFKNLNFDITMLLRDAGVQAIPSSSVKEIQTNWNRNVNMALQTDTTTELEAEIQASLNDATTSLTSPTFPKLIATETLKSPTKSRSSNTADVTAKAKVDHSGGCSSNVYLSIELALHQNETVNLFTDDFETLTEDEVVLGAKSDNYMKEFQSFTDFEFSKDKVISALDWSPSGKGIVAVSCADKADLDTRLQTRKVTSSVMLIWNFVDPIHPQIILEAPSDIQCFRFHPKRQDILVAGCLNGQIVFWDTSSVLESGSKGTNQYKYTSSPDEDKKATPLTVLPFLVSSSIENSHKKSVTDLVWLNKVGNDGSMTSVMGNDCYQFLTCSRDGQVLVWDIEEFLKPVQSKEDRVEQQDLCWCPVYSCTLVDSATSIPYALTRVCFFSEEERAEEDVVKILCSAEEGFVLMCDWSTTFRYKKEDSISKLTADHFGPVVTIQQSPFFPDIFLTAGDWTVKIWKTIKGIPVCLITSPCTLNYVTVARWSPKRPGVFFVGRADGSVDMWDLTDRSHAPSLSQNICSPSAITSMEFISEARSEANSKRSVQLLAVGDSQGRLHVLEVPRHLAHKVQKEVTVEQIITLTPTKKSLLQNYFAREERRVGYVSKREIIRRQSSQLEIKALE